MLIAILTLSVSQAIVPAQSRLIVGQGSDTTAHAVTDTIDVPLGTTVVLRPRIVAARILLRPDSLWVHNVSPELVSFEGPIGRDRFSADPIRVKGVQPGIAPVMVHWAMESGGAIFITFRVVDRNDTARSERRRVVDTCIVWHERGPPWRRASSPSPSRVSRAEGSHVGCVGQ